MTLDACIRATATELGADEAEVRQIAERIEAYRKRRITEGRFETLDADVRRFAGDEATRARVAAAKRRQQAAVNVILAAEWDRDLGQLREGGLSEEDAIIAKLVGVVAGVAGGRVSAGARRVALESKWLTGIDAELQREAPGLWRQLREATSVPHQLRNAVGRAQVSPDLQRRLDNIVAEMAELREGGRPGITGDAEAQAAARILRTRAEEARLAANRQGANIGRLDGWAGPQSHDPDRLRAATEATWRDQIKPLLDLERSFPGLDPKQIDEVLGEIWATVVTGRDRQSTARQRGQRVGPANLARSLEASRVLHFKDAASWSAYAKVYAGGNIVTDMIGHLAQMARTVSLMQVMGPNPQSFLEQVIERRRAEARTGARGNADQAVRDLRQLKADLDRGEGAIGRAFAEVMGDTHAVHSITGAKISSGVRALTSMAKLGAAVVSSVTDLATYAAAARWQGKSLLAGYGDALGALLAGRTTDQQRQIVSMLGVAVDSLQGDMLSRFDTAENLPGRLAAASNAFFRLSGLTWWTQRLKGAFAAMQGALAGENARLAHAELDDAYRHVLALHGIDEQRWEVLRQAVSQQADGRAYIMPDDVARLGDEAFIPLADAAIADVRLGISDWWARLSQANRRDADWATARVERYREKFGRARDRLEKLRGKVDEKNGRQVELVQSRIAEMEERLSELGEAARELGGKQRALGRDEGSLRRRVVEAEAAVRRLHGRAQADARGLGADFEALWQRRQDEVLSFLDRVKERTAHRDELLASLPAVEQRRVAQVIERERFDLEMKLREFYSDETSFAVLEPDDRVRSMLVHGTSRGTVTGELWRFLTQFKAFPVAYTYKILGRARYGRAGIRPDYGALPHIIASSLVLGYVAMAGKDFLKNRTPKDPTLPETWIAAMLQGGGLGLYGDFLFGQADRFGGGFGASLLPPASSLPLALVDLWHKVRAGEAKAGDAFYPILNSIPFLNLWWARSALDLAILNQLQEWVSPGSLRRREQPLINLVDPGHALGEERARIEFDLQPVTVRRRDTTR